MISNLTAAKMLFFTVGTILATLLLVGAVVFYEPPAFIGFFFGSIAGANWILLLGLYLQYMEQSS